MCAYVRACACACVRACAGGFHSTTHRTTGGGRDTQTYPIIPQRAPTVDHSGPQGGAAISTFHNKLVLFTTNWYFLQQSLGHPYPKRNKLVKLKKKLVENMQNLCRHL